MIDIIQEMQDKIWEMFATETPFCACCWVEMEFDGEFIYCPLCGNAILVNDE